MLAPAGRSSYPTRMNARIRIRSLLVLSALIALGAANACRSSGPLAEAGDGATYVVGVEGMSCELSCAPKVKEALESIDGVKSADVSFEDKRAVVKMAAGHDLTREACDKSFDNQGYFVSSFDVAAATGEAAPPAPDGEAAPDDDAD
jgi:copper chaperone CopZ